MEFVENENIKMPLIGLGTFTMHGEQLSEVISNALQLGYRLFDTATKYNNEEDLGNSLKESIGVLIQSKVHFTQIKGNLRYLRLNKKSIKKSLELSSRRLNTIPDIYLLHSAFTGYKRYFEKLVMLRNNGYLRAIGICNIELEQLKNLIEKSGEKPDVVQVEIHPYHNNKALIEYCHEQEIIVEARSPFAHGDALQEWMNNSKLKTIAHRHEKNVPQVILRWIIQQKVIPIVRTTKITHLRENINIFDFDLTEDDNNYIFSLNKDLSYGSVSSNNNSL